METKVEQYKKRLTRHGISDTIAEALGMLLFNMDWHTDPLSLSDEVLLDRVLKAQALFTDILNCELTKAREALIKR